MAGLLDSIQQTLNSHIAKGMNSPLGALSMGLLGASQPGSNMGQQIQGAFGNQVQRQLGQQQLGMNQLQMQMLQARLPGLLKYFDTLGGLMGPPPSGAAAPPGASAPPASPGGTSPSQGAGNALPAIQQIPQLPAQLGTPMTGAPGRLPASSAPPAPTSAGAPSGVGAPDPFAMMRLGAFGSAVGAPGADAILDYGKTLAQYSPQLATQQAAAKSELVQDQYNLQRAQASGNPTMIKAAQMKLLTDSKLVNIASYNNALTTFGGVTPSQLGINTINPVQGVQTRGGVETPIPGAPQTEAALAGARASGTAAGEAPYELVPVVGPDKQTYIVPKSILLRGAGAPGNGAAGSSNGGAAVGPIPGNALAGAVGVSRQSPEQSSQQTAAGTGAGEELTELNKQADSARQANYTLDQLRQLGRGVTLGPGAPAKEWFEQVAAPLAQTFGMQPPRELGNYQQINKFGNTLAFNAARAMGSREAAQIVQLQIASNPNKGLVSDAYNGLIDSMEAMNNYVLAKNYAIQAAASGAQITARQATANWETEVDPRVWDLAISPQLASRFSGQIGVDKISKAMPFMATEDAIRTMRNIAPALRSQVLRGLPPAAKQEILSALQSTAPQGATGTF